jgi:hypothetical protein
LDLDDPSLLPQLSSVFSMQSEVHIHNQIAMEEEPEEENTDYWKNDAVYVKLDHV